ncbi:MAG: ferredoxin [Candidatus Aenigmatarchaeota archaeon]
MKEPVVDEGKCSGYGVCATLAPNVFELNDEGIAEVVDPQGDDENEIQKAIDACPEQAISWKGE